MNARSICAAWIVLASFALAARAADEAKPIAIADVKHEGPVSFEKEVLPVLAKNCLACHNATKSESSLVLETPQSIAKGGDSGPAVVAGKSAESLLLKVASHQDEPLMPPAGNGVGAVALSGEQLGLIKLWIDQGAASDPNAAKSALHWQSLPKGINPVYAVAVTPDGQYAACGRANQIFVYHLASGQLVARLNDPAVLKSGLYQNEGVAHLDLVQSLAFSPDGELLASGSYREVKLWRRPHNVRRADLAGGESPAPALAASADGKWAATGEANGSIKLWDLATGKVARSLTGHSGPIAGVRFVAGGAKLVSASADKTIRLWSVADGSAIVQLETPTPLAALEVVSDGALAATGGSDNIVRLWTLPTEPGGAVTPAGELAGHTGPISALAAIPAQKNQLYSGSADGTIRLWNLEAKQSAREIKHGAAIAALAVRGDGKQIASSGVDNQVKLWNAADGSPWASPDKQPIAPLKGDARLQFEVARATRALEWITAKVADDKKAVADAEAKIVTASAAVTAGVTAKETAAKTLAEKTAAVKAPTEAKAAADKELAAANEALKAATEKAAQAKTAAEAKKDDAELAKANDAAAKAAAEADKKAKELEKKAQEAAAALAKATGEATTAEAANMAAEQAAAAAVVAVKKTVTDVPVAEQALRDSEAALAKAQAANEAAKKSEADSEKPFRTLAYSADGSQLLAGGDNLLVRSWASETGRAIESFAGAKGPVLAAAFTADGSILATSADGTTTLWNPAPAWTLERTIGNVDDSASFVDRVLALAFSPDGKTLATGGGEPSRSGEVKLWNVADGAAVRTIADAHSDTVFGLEFSPDGAYLASCAADRFVKVFNVAAGKLHKSFEGHTHHVLDVAWKADGKILASGGADNVIKVWDFITGDQRRTIAGFTKEVTSLAFVASSPKIVATSGDKSVKLINTDDGKTERSFAGSSDFMYAIAATADGRITVSGGQDSVLFAWLVDDGQKLRSFEAPKSGETDKPLASAGK